MHITPEAGVTGLIDEIKTVFAEEIQHGYRGTDQEGNLTSADFHVLPGEPDSTNIRFSSRRDPFGEATLFLSNTATRGRERMASLSETAHHDGYHISGQVVAVRDNLAGIQDPIAGAQLLLQREIALQQRRLAQRTPQIQQQQ